MRLFIGGLSYDTTESDLSEFFTTPDITVNDARVMRDKETNRSRGFGFVDVETNLHVGKVIEQFDGAKCGGKRVTVNEARPREDRHERSRYAKR